MKITENDDSSNQREIRFDLFDKILAYGKLIIKSEKKLHFQMLSGSCSIKIGSVNISYYNSYFFVPSKFGRKKES